ncbi:MAG: hypothetical protein RIT81_46855 [Deltaproteobacteria bacterium]
MPTVARGALGGPIALLLVSACASTSGVGSGRVFVRNQADAVKLKKIDVVVTVAAVQTSGPQLNVATFDVPQMEAPLLPSAEDPATRDELVKTLRQALEQRGFDARFIFAGADEEPPGAAVKVMPPIDTSTVTVSPVGTSTLAEPGAPDLTPNPPREPEPSRRDLTLEAGTTLAAVFQATDADGLLVVRVVPVDAFYMFQTIEENQIVDLSTTITPITDDAPTPRSGRLMFGQVFLYDHETRLRLWSKNLPEFPESSRLTTDAAFLDYGLLTELGQPELPPARRAEVAATNFVRTMFSDFLEPTDGSQAGRDMLAAVDPEIEAARQAFLDEGWIGLGIDFGWTGETSGSKVVFEDDNDPNLARTIELGTGAIAPSGVFRLTPRMDIVSPGGFSFEIGVPLGFGPGSFARTYHFDNPDAGLADTDRGARATISGPTVAGLEIGAGYVLPLNATLDLFPTIGLFGEGWFLDTSPVIDSNVHVRLGAKANFDAIIHPSPSSALFVRAGGGVRVGVDTAGPVIFGATLNVGVGMFL